MLIKSEYLMTSPCFAEATYKFDDEIASWLMYGFCNSGIWVQQAAAGSPEADKCPSQYSFPTISQKNYY